MPGANVYVLHKDMRTYGFKEKYYTEAREKGVIFVRYDDEHKPKVVQGERRLQVAAWDSAMGEEISIPADLVVVNTAIIPEEGNSELAQTLKVPVTKEGFFLEAHVKLRPVDFSSEGLFVAGLAHYPKFAEETIAQALSASARAATILSQPNLEVGAVVAEVNGAKCAGCLTCVRACPYAVPQITRMQVAEIEPAQCHGCGICVAECPAKAIQLTHYDDRQIIAKSDALLVEVA